jgi:hypothetical protein
MNINRIPLNGIIMALAAGLALVAASSPFFA